MNITIQRFQGDCQAHSVDAIPSDIQFSPLPKDGYTVLIGEGSNKHHRVTATVDSEIVFAQGEDGKTYMRVLTGEALLQHLTMPDFTQADHSPLTLPVGDYVFGGQYEYDEVADRKVVD
jgi:hypothetical protein